jgi:hypothetical protein
MRQVASFSLDFPRGDVVQNNEARWLPWKDGYNSISPGQLGAYPQPMLTDIEFADNGDMILGFRDRNGDMTFFDPGGQNPPGEGTGIPAGDILISRYNGDTWDTSPEPEFFAEDWGPIRGPFRAAHDETGFGGLARKLRLNPVVSTGLAPLDESSGGAYWFDMASSTLLAREEIYDFESQVNFGKANGLGDLELACGPDQPTETPTVTATAPPDTPTPSATATATATAVTETPTATVTTAASVTVVPTTPAPTQTPPPTLTMVVPTQTPVSTTVREERRETDVPPASTRELPALPQTGGGGSGGAGSAGSTAAYGLLSAAVLLGFALKGWRRFKGRLAAL